MEYITKEAVEKGSAVIRNKGKIRKIFLPKLLCKMLKEYAKRNKVTTGSIFVTRTGKPVDRFWIWKMLKSLCAAARVVQEKVFPHNLRHLFARIFYAKEKDVVRLADILGHSSINTTRIYTIESGDIHRRKIEKVSEFLLQGS